MADVDISGFTEITEQLSVHGREAAELLQDVLAAVFQPLTAGVYEAGGFIANFSGDGFLAVFPEGPGLDPAALRGMAAAWNFRQAVRSRHSFRTRFGTFSFNARIGLSAGQIRWEIFGAKNQRRHVWFFGGEPVLNATRCRTHADIGSLNADDAVLDALDDRVSVTVEPARFGSAVVDTGPLRIDPLQIDPSPVLPAGPVDPLNADFYPVELIHAHGRGEFRQSVNLFVRLDNPDRDLQRFADALLAAQARYGGYLQDITEGDKGCLALIFWGAPVAMENDLGRALEFVSALQARPEFRIAAGLTCGLAHAGFMGSSAHEVYSCNSKSVNLAARLMSAAPLGEVYLDTAARDRGLDRFDIEFVDHLDLKGFTDPQAAYRLTGTRRAPVGLEISGAMIGRDADLSALQNDLSACLAGEGPCTAALAGEAGIGKTHLIAELQARGLSAISDLVWHELTADGVLEQPFAPFGRFIASLAGIVPDGSDAQRRAAFDGWFDGFLNGIEYTDTAAELTRTRSFLAALVDVTQDDDVYQRIGQ
ncbi:MAG: AAA family ATPase, partial [Pseudomonadota bacterium]